MKGRDGKTYRVAASKPKKPSRKPIAESKTVTPTDVAWQDFLTNLANVSEFVKSIDPQHIPEDSQSWQLATTLEQAARALLAAATRLRTSPT